MASSGIFDLLAENVTRLVTILKWYYFDYSSYTIIIGQTAVLNVVINYDLEPLIFGSTIHVFTHCWCNLIRWSVEVHEAETNGHT